MRLILSVADKMNANFRVLAAMCRDLFFVNLDCAVQVGKIIFHDQIENAIYSAAGEVC